MRAEPDSPMPYPQNYRQWVHVKSGLVGPQSQIYAHYGGLHHIYANDKAIEGYRTGHFPDGSVIVFDLLEVQESAGVTTESARRFIDVMTKDSQRYADTGGWGYEEFKGDSQTEHTLTAETRAQCAKCHAAQNAHDFVFSTFRQ